MLGLKGSRYTSGGLNKKREGGGDPSDNLNINKYQKWQPVITNYGDCFG